MSAALERLHRHCGLLLLFVVSMTVAWKASQQYAPPVGGLPVLILPPGGADLYVPWASARAYLGGKDPYRTPLGDPFSEPRLVNGQPVYILYPPGNVTFHLPLAYFFEDRIAAAKAFFVINFAAIIALSVITWLVLRAVRSSIGKSDTPAALLLPFFLTLALCTHTAYAFERGQSEILMSVLCWGALLLFWKGRTFATIFLVSVATLMKGYSGLFGLGLGLLSLNRLRWKHAVTGAVAAGVLLLVPLRSYLSIGFAAMRARSDLPCNNDFNHGFSEFFREVAPSTTMSGRYVMTSFGLLISAVCWWNARRGSRGGRPLWLFHFALFSLLTLVGYSTCSCPYNFTLAIPGILVFLACAPELLESVGFSRPAATTISMVEAVPACLMFLDGVGGRFSGTGAGIVAFMALNGVALIVAVVRHGRSFPAQATAPASVNG